MIFIYNLAYAFLVEGAYSIDRGSAVLGLHIRGFTDQVLHTTDVVQVAAGFIRAGNTKDTKIVHMEGVIQVDIEADFATTVTLVARILPS